VNEAARQVLPHAGPCWCSNLIITRISTRPCPPQVCPREVRLIVDEEARQVLPLSALLPDPADAEDEDLVIAGAEIAGGYSLLLLGDGAAVLLLLDAGTGAAYCNRGVRTCGGKACC